MCQLEGKTVEKEIERKIFLLKLTYNHRGVWKRQREQVNKERHRDRDRDTVQRERDSKRHTDRGRDNKEHVEITFSWRSRIPPQPKLYKHLSDITCSQVLNQ